MHDIFAIEEAKKTIGDYKLKTSSTFNLLSDERDTLFSKYKQLLNCREKVCTISSNLKKKKKTLFLITRLRIFCIKNSCYIYIISRLAVLSTRSFQCKIENCKNRERTFTCGNCTFNKVS